MINKALDNTKEIFKKIDDIALHNQNKVLSAFQNNYVALRHFAGTSGYGYDDIGKDTLAKIFAEVFSTESAIASPLIANGTHAITLALFGLLKSGDTALSISGQPYDTLVDVVSGKGNGGLTDYNINFEKVDLVDGKFDKEEIAKKISMLHPKIIYVQRSRGYEWRNAFSISDLTDIFKFVKQHTDAKIVVDNCYGEFVEKLEPTDVGADVCIGSLIKNIGGGLCPTGGYIVGGKDSIDSIANRLTAPGIGAEVGSYMFGYNYYYQGLFMAPHTVAQAIKTGCLFSEVLTNLGYDVLPKPKEQFFDIVCSVKFPNEEKLIKFVQSIQAVSPIDSFVTPEPWDMPGYNHKVIMSAGCFVQGSSIELSCDAPIKPPYIAYLQGGLTLEHGIIALQKAVEQLEK